MRMTASVTLTVIVVFAVTSKEIPLRVLHFESQKAVDSLLHFRKKILMEKYKRLV